MIAYKYKAFISYSHKDERWARWLHRRLENYPIPSHLIGKQTNSGVVPKRLKPIFRDREELAAADSLGEKIEQALADSENLIIICSPHAAQSHWVNQEIIFFKRQNRGAKIFSLIVDGEPFASKISGREKGECFPAALRFKVDTDGNITKGPAEPLAADIRTQGDGKRLGLLKLISGMIGVGLDEIVQRDMRRGRKRVMAITATFLIIVLAMGTLTGFAISARKDAEARRNDAEENIEFMITDLKKELESVGRLSALKVVGKRAEAYYDKYPISKHNDEALARRARVFHYLGEILNTEGYRDNADEYFKRSYKATEALLARDPKNADRIFGHAQSSFYVGNLLWLDEKFQEARTYFDEYIDLAKALQRVEPDSLRSKQEVIYAYTNLGIVLLGQKKAEEAYQIYINAIPTYEDIVREDPTEIKHSYNLADAYGWIADAAIKLNKLYLGMEYRQKQYDFLKPLQAKHPQDKKITYRNLTAITGLADAKKRVGDFTDAKNIIAGNIAVSENLWNSDPTNTRWLKNVISIILLNAEISIELLEIEHANNAITKLKIYEQVFSLRLYNKQSEEFYAQVLQRREKTEIAIRKAGEPAGINTQTKN